jgi:hypothetical protein
MKYIRKIEKDGRRIYIHEASFISLASRSNAAAELVFTTLAVTSTLKILHHHISQALEFDLLDNNKAKRLHRRVNSKYGQILSIAFRQIGYQSNLNGRHDFCPLIQFEERIIASCTEAGYFTFATGNRAAIRMFAEKGNMHEERAAIKEGYGPSDLVWINGNNLALLDPSLPVGQNTAKFYFGRHIEQGRISADELNAVKQKVTLNTLTELELKIRGRDSWDTPHEVQLFKQLSLTMRSALSKGIFSGVAFPIDIENERISPYRVCIPCSK